jgi:surfeit locus 1 family protein
VVERVAGRHRPRSGLGLALVVAVTFVALLGLGTWQLQRLAWKTDLIDRAEAGLRQDPVPLPETTPDWRRLDYRRVVTEGRFVLGEALLVGTSARGGVLGGRLVVPLLLADARLVLVDLGWLPDGAFTTERIRTLLPPGAVSVSGVALYRADRAPDLFTPAPHPERGRWYGWDLAAMSRAIAAELLPVVIVREVPPLASPWPAQEPVGVELPNSHLGYALTWYGLALALAVIYVLFARAHRTGAEGTQRRRPEAVGAPDHP